MKSKIVSAAQAVAIIRCGDTVACSGFIGNYDGVTIDAGVADTCAAMVRYMDTHCYLSATRYSTSAFLRMKPGEALAHRSVAPNIFESAAEAHSFLRDHAGNEAP